MYNLGAALFPATENDPGLDPNSAINLLKSTSEHNGQTESNHKASMLLDIEQGRPMELDVVVGEVVRLGRKNGIAMPVSADIGNSNPRGIHVVLENRDSLCVIADRARSARSSL